MKSLSLHNNQFSALPPDIIRLDLQELSLRNNPLVVRFVRDLTYDVPTLKELSARSIKLHKLDYDYRSLPKSLVDYLNAAKSCLNPKCKGQISSKSRMHSTFERNHSIFRSVFRKLSQKHQIC